MKNNLYLIIQPLQYLQALELVDRNEFNTLFVLKTGAIDQMKRLVNESDWDRVVWVNFSGTVLDIIKNIVFVKSILEEFRGIEKLVVSSFYNEFVNCLANGLQSKELILLEDGNATLLLEHGVKYNSFRFKIKKVFTFIFGFNVQPMSKVNLYLLKRKNVIDLPSFAKNAYYFDFKRLKKRLTAFQRSDKVCFISSAFINAGIMKKSNYINFLKEVINVYPSKTFEIVLHRFDNAEDFSSLLELDNVFITESTGPIELMFNKNKSLPSKVISAGSGATETLETIYGIKVEVVLPHLKWVEEEFHQQMNIMVSHFNKHHIVSRL
ncbi:hypothetical protein [Catenovulum maritimum]|uniref:Uncharacterized protein n=1 Tax=Catenovulum maritimum TaxID=1513271 RepID=A0A0J8GPP5_9ALTE|nr:hypothetical protein [Catenovulum maritimum]KMT64742.1 hypothetical protein XM47_12850 [Catenovulum maritimum]